MAQRALNQDDISCPICLDFLKNPVTIPCGHSYCMSCIQNHWDQQVRFSCPQCRESFTPRPVLVKTTVLANLVEELKKTGLTAPPSDHCFAVAGDVSCDLCSGRKMKAVKSCLQCLVSYCEFHLQPHHDVAKLQKHQLVEPSDRLEENLCSQHNKLMEIFCRTDEQIICYICCLEQHKGHDTVSSAAERALKQEGLQTQRALLHKILQDRESDLKRLQQEAEDIISFAQKAVQRSRDSFKAMALLLDKKRTEVEQQIQSEEQRQLKQVQKLQDQLQRDVTELRKSITEMDTVCSLQDHNQFIQQSRPLDITGFMTESQVESRIKINREGDFEDMTRALSVLRDQFHHTLKEFKLTESKPTTRDDFLRFSCDIILDPNTAGCDLALSEDNRRATRVFPPLKYPDHPDRFIYWSQVMSREGLTGRCYWEVEVTWKGRVLICVTYKDIERKKWDESFFGRNNKSWALECYMNTYTFWFNNNSLKVPGPLSNRIGVYLDHSAGTLTFYSVKDQTMNLLHKVQTTFTQPLYAGLLVYSDSAKFPKLKE